MQYAEQTLNLRTSDAFPHLLKLLANYLLKPDSKNVRKRKYPISYEI